MLLPPQRIAKQIGDMVIHGKVAEDDIPFDPAGCDHFDDLVRNLHFVIVALPFDIDIELEIHRHIRVEELILFPDLMDQQFTLVLPFQCPIQLSWAPCNDACRRNQDEQCHPENIRPVHLILSSRMSGEAGVIDPLQVVRYDRDPSSS